MSLLRYLHSMSIPKGSLDWAGLVALADLSTVAQRTALTGSSSLLDMLVICPGMHKQQDAPNVSRSEYPACAAMTTGYVFRVENEATVFYLQRVGRTGHLTNLRVTNAARHTESMNGSVIVSTTAYLSAVGLTLTVSLLLYRLRDLWALTVLSLFVLARLLNVVVVRSRASVGWKGASEPGVNGDSLILLSQDRWIRLRGAVDDLKAVTSGQWLRDPTFLESSMVAFATLLVYLDAALAGNASIQGKVLLGILLFCSTGLLGVANEFTKVLKMHGRLITVDGEPIKYERRLNLAQQLIRETGREDWAVRMGMIVSEEPGKQEGPVTM